MKKRNIILALLLLAFIGTGSTFAWWFSGAADATLANQTNNKVTVGQAEDNEVATLITLGGNETGYTLVPANQIDNSVAGAVGVVMLSYSVDWDSDEDAFVGATGVLTATFDSATVEFGGEAVAGAVLNVDIQVGGTVTGTNFDGNGSGAITLDGVAVTVWVKITLDEPSTQEIYDDIAGKVITFEIDFKVTA